MRPSRRISRRFETQADRRVNSIGWDEEFRNQQVAGSIPAGGSKDSLKTQHFDEPQRLESCRFCSMD